jgi:predicted CopG family antitoxin
MAKQIAVSDEVYNMLLKMKGQDKSFTEVIKEMLKKRDSMNIMKFAGSGKKYSKELQDMAKRIQEDRDKSSGRTFDE